MKTPERMHEFLFTNGASVCHEMKTTWHIAILQAQELANQFVKGVHVYVRERQHDSLRSFSWTDDVYECTVYPTLPGEPK